MKYQSQWLLTSAVAMGLLTLPVLAAGATYFVSGVSGTDSGDCSSSTCKTIGYAAANVPAGTAGSPNTIQVAPGTYSATTNGDSFPATFANDYVSLVGDDAGSTIIEINEEVGLDVTGTGFSVSGFTFSDAGTAIEFTGGRGGYTVSDNIFNDTVEIAINSRIANQQAGESFIVAPISITSNEFYSSNYGVYFSMDLTFDRSTTGLSATIGDILVSDNLFTTEDNGFYLDEMYINGLDFGTVTVGTMAFTENTFVLCSRGIDIDVLSVHEMSDSTVTWGDIAIDGNFFSHTDDAIYFYGTFGLDSQSVNGSLFNTSLTMGDVSVSNNTITDNSGTAIEMDYFNVQSVTGSSTLVLGDVTVHNNTVDSSDPTPVVSKEGIILDDTGNIRDIHDNARITKGTITVTDNHVKSGDIALVVIGRDVRDIGEKGRTDTAAIDIGPTTVSGNTLNSNNNSFAVATLAIGDFGVDQYAYTTVSMGLWTVDNNDITADSEVEVGLFIEFYESGRALNDYTELTLPGSTITNNRISIPDESYAGLLLELGRLGNNMFNSSQMTVGTITVSDNTVTGGNDALVSYFEDVAFDLHDSSIFTMSPWTISENTLTSAGSSEFDATMFVFYGDASVGTGLDGDSSATLPDWIVHNNSIDATEDSVGFIFESYFNPSDNYGNAAVHFGSMLIDGNIFNPNKDTGMAAGPIVYLAEVCADCSNSSTFTLDDISISNNKIYGAAEGGIGVFYEGVGQSITGDGQITMGDVSITDNIVDAAGFGIYALYDGLNTDDSATVTLGTLNISDNTALEITREGIRVDISGFSNSATAALNIGKTLILDNIATASTTAGPFGSSPSGSSGGDTGIRVSADIATGVVFPAPEVNNNTVSWFADGVGFHSLSEASMSCNTLKNNAIAGLFFASDGNFTATSNSLVDNGIGLGIDAGNTATVMAARNWWGDPAGPEACVSCNKIDTGGGTVEFDPWLGSESAMRCGGFSWPMFMPALISGGLR